MSHEHHHEEHEHQLPLIIATVVLLGVAVWVEHTFNLSTWQLLLVYLVPYLLIGHDTLKEAAEGLVHGEAFNEHFLMAIATIGALLIGFLPGAETEFPEAVFVMLFFQVGELFEGYAEGKSRESIAHLMDIRPDVVNVERQGQVTVVSPDQVAVGETIVVKPGEKVALDGFVLEGTSALNTLALTGESVPRDIAVGDEVISGCVNLSGVIKVRTTKSFGESTVSKIINLVENATEHKSKSETFISKFARVYTPVVVAAALIIAVVPPLIISLTSHLEVRTCLYSYCRRCCADHRYCPPTVGRLLPHLVLSCIDVPRRELSLCFGAECSADLLRRHRRCIAKGYLDQGRELYRCAGKDQYRRVRQDGNADTWTIRCNCRTPRGFRRTPVAASGCSCGALLHPSHRCCAARRLPR